MSQQLQGEAVSLIGSWSQKSEWQLPNFISNALAHSQQNAHSLYVEEWLAEDLLCFGKFRLPGGRVVCVNMTSDLYLLGLRGSVENLT